MCFRFVKTLLIFKQNRNLLYVVEWWFREFIWFSESIWVQVSEFPYYGLVSESVLPMSFTLQDQNFEVQKYRTSSYLICVINNCKMPQPQGPKEPEHTWQRG
jgi:hypothetical protein